MPTEGVEERHSQTALVGALYRAVANKEYKNKRLRTGLGPGPAPGVAPEPGPVLGSDYLADRFLPWHLRQLIKLSGVQANWKKTDAQHTPGMWVYMLARTAFFDGAFVAALQSELPQIVVLGAGYDTRAYRFDAQNKATTIFELDIAPTQERKIECLQKAKLAPPKRLVLTTIDFNRESIPKVLAQAGYDSDKRTLFVWEGVSYYLETEAVHATLEFCAAAATHSLLTMDYAVPLTEQNLNTLYGAKEFAATWKEHRPNEPFKFGIEEGDIEALLEPRGLRLIKDYSPDDIEEAFLLREDGTPIGQAPGAFHFAMAEPDNEPQDEKAG